MDFGSVDAGTMDAGTMDAGTMDAGTTDTGTMDTVGCSYLKKSGAYNDLKQLLQK